MWMVHSFFPSSVRYFRIIAKSIRQSSQNNRPKSAVFYHFAARVEVPDGYEVPKPAKSSPIRLLNGYRACVVMGTRVSPSRGLFYSSTRLVSLPGKHLIWLFESWHLEFAVVVEIFSYSFDRSVFLYTCLRQNKYPSSPNPHVR